MSAAAAQTKAQIMAGVISPLLGRVIRPSSFSIPGDIGDQSRVLVVDSGDLTELLFFSPVISFLKKRFPGMRVTFLVREGNSELIRGMEHINEMISYEPAHFSLASTTYFSLVKRIRNKDFTIAFLLGCQFNFARSLLSLLSGARLRMGFSQEYTFPYINCELREPRSPYYEGEKALAYLKGLGFNSELRLPKWNLPEQDVKWARQMVHFRKPGKKEILVAVDPGKGKGNHRLVDESFVYLVDNLSRRHPCKVMVLSNNLERKGLERFKSLLKTEVLDLDAKNVKEGVALLSCADLFLSGNTDFFHFAVEMRVPTVGLFTRYDMANWMPKNSSWVQILQGMSGQKLLLEEFFSKIDTLLHFTGSR